jgi:alpha-beta hydrolase superfamily lysophospholipase
MSKQIDYSQLDQPHILAFVFYPRPDWSSPPPGAIDHSVPVADGISISCRFYPAGESAPNVLYFHGNGEVVYDYDGIAPMYNREGVNLFVADYRGYGQSGGSPSFSNTVADAQIIFNYFRDTLKESGYNGPLFIMGRSLGSLSAIELASSRSEEFRGLIIESGFAGAGRLLTFLVPVFESVELDEFDKANMENIRSITLPILIIHGEWDEIIPYEQARILHQNVSSQDKKLLTIPNAGHNDILLLGMEQYFSAIREFVFSH